MRRLVPILAFVLTASRSAFAESSHHEITPMEQDDIRHTFTSVRFTTGQGSAGVCIDLVAYVETTLRGCLLPLTDMSLLMYHRDLTRLQQIAIRPSFFNSFNLGRVDVVKSEEDVPYQMKAIEIESKQRHPGALLFLLPEDAILIHAIRLRDKTTPIREVPDRYLDRPRLDLDNVRHIGAGVEIPMQPRIHLVNV